MTRSLLVLGCGGHGRVVADIALDCGFNRIAFLDDAFAELKHKVRFPILGPLAMFNQLVDEWQAAMVAIGNNFKRLELFQELQSAGYEMPALVHPSAVVSRAAYLEKSVLVGPTAVINTGARIADAAIVNTGACIDHDCIVEDGSHLAPSVTLSGNVVIGKRAWLGTGCVVRQGVRIGDDAIVGVGAAVVCDLPGECTYVGVPARPIGDKA